MSKVVGNDERKILIYKVFMWPLPEGRGGGQTDQKLKMAWEFQSSMGVLRVKMTSCIKINMIFRSGMQN